MSRKFESGGGRPAAIGYDKSGGYSYGSYQISTASSKGGSGTMPAFLSHLKTAAPDLHAQLINAGGAAGARAGSKQFMDAWNSVTNSNPQRFADLQHGFIKNTHYDPVAHQLAEIKGFDLARRSAAVKEAIWSVAVQHGQANASLIFDRALEGRDVAGLPDDALLRAVYQERSRVNVYFPSLPPAEQEKIRKRFSRELEDVLKIVKDQPPVPVRPRP